MTSQNKGEHDFQRDRSSNHCILCNNLWPSCDGVISKFSKCSKCDLSVHSSCVPMAKSCYACEAVKRKGIPRTVSGSNFVYNGKLRVRLLHVYDLDVVAGTILYGVIKLSSGVGTLKTSMATVGDRDCVWSDSIRDSSREEDFLQELDLAVASSPTEKMKDIFLQVEVWKSMMRLFDSPIAECEVALRPLLLHPKITTERWFELKDSYSNQCGKILLSLTYFPAYGYDLRTSVSLDNLVSSVESDVPRAKSALGSNEDSSTARANIGDICENASVDRVGAVVKTETRIDLLDDSKSAATKTVIDSVCDGHALTTSSGGGRPQSKIDVNNERKENKMAAVDDQTQLQPPRPTSPDKNTGSPGAPTPAVNSSANLSAAKNIKAGSSTPPSRRVSLFKIAQPPESSSVSTAHASAFAKPSDQNITDTPSANHNQSTGLENKTLSLQEASKDLSLMKSDALENDSQVNTALNSSSASSEAPRGFNGDASAEGDIGKSTIGLRRRINQPSVANAITAVSEAATAQSILPLSAAADVVSSGGDQSVQQSSGKSSVVKKQQMGGIFGDFLGFLPPVVGQQVPVVAEWTKKLTQQVMKRVQYGRKKGRKSPGIGVGKLHVQLISALKKDAADSAEGNYYVIVSIEDSDQEERTDTVYSSSAPVFNRSYQFLAPHFRSGVRMDLMDADTDRRLGTSFSSVHSLLIRDGDLFNGDWKAAGEETFYIRESDLSEKEPIGHFIAVIKFEEDVSGLFTSSTPHFAPCGPEETLSVERLRVHIGRFQALISWIKSLYVEYCSIMNWDDPLMTAVLFLIFLYMCLSVEAEYGLSCPLFILVVLMTRSLVRRRNGTFRRLWIERLIGSESASAEAALSHYRPMAKLRFSVVGFRCGTDHHHHHQSTSGAVSAPVGTATSGSYGADVTDRRPGSSPVTVADGNSHGPGKKLLRPPYIKVTFVAADNKTVVGPHEHSHETSKSVSLDNGNTVGPVSAASKSGESASKFNWMKADIAVETGSNSLNNGDSSFERHRRRSMSEDDASINYSNSNNSNINEGRETSNASLKQANKKKEQHLVACISTSLTASGGANQRGIGRFVLNFLRTDGARDEILQNLCDPWPIAPRVPSPMILGSKGKKLNSIYPHSSSTTSGGNSNRRNGGALGDVVWVGTSPDEGSADSISSGDGTTLCVEEREQIGDLSYHYPIVQPLIESEVVNPVNNADDNSTGTALSKTSTLDTPHAAIDPALARSSPTQSNASAPSSHPTASNAAAVSSASSHTVNPSSASASSSSGNLTASQRWRQSLQPWSTDQSTLRFALYGDHPLSTFMDSSWGAYVDVPIKDLVDSGADERGGLQRERRGWYTIHWKADSTNKNSNNRSKRESDGHGGRQEYGSHGNIGASGEYSSLSLGKTKHSGFVSSGLSLGGDIDIDFSGGSYYDTSPAPMPSNRSRTANRTGTAAVPSSRSLDQHDAEGYQSQTTSPLQKSSVLLDPKETGIDEDVNCVPLPQQSTLSWLLNSALYSSTATSTSSSSGVNSSDAATSSMNAPSESLTVIDRSATTGAVTKRELSGGIDSVAMTTQIFLRLQLQLPDLTSDPTPEEIDKSNALLSILSGKSGKGENAISVIWNMRDNIKYVQNLMNTILKAVETYKNLLNWTSPTMSLPIYLSLIGLWIATVFVPGRYLLLGWGLYQFLYRFFPEPDTLPNYIRCVNIIEAVPNDDDLQQAYWREQKEYENRRHEAQKKRNKSAKLNLIFDCLWTGQVELKGTGMAGGGTWTSAFMVLQENRLVWWTKEEDVDDCKAPIGHILLFGHAGTTQPSPVDVREIGDDSRLATIFGRDSNGMPQKRTVLCRDISSCQQLVQCVNSIVNNSIS